MAARLPGTGVWQVLWGLLKIVIMLALVGWLAFISVRLLSRRMPDGRGRGTVRVLGYVYLGGRRGVSLLKVGPRILVLGVTDHQVSLLESVTDPAEVAAIEESATPPVVSSLTEWAESRRWRRLSEQMHKGFGRILAEKLARGGKGGGRRDPADE